jgi:hypothetical protein
MKTLDARFEFLFLVEALSEELGDPRHIDVDVGLHREVNLAGPVTIG